MSDVHHPLTHPRSISALVIELVMISFAVYLGVFAEQWREERHQNQLAQQALSNFRAEILTNPDIAFRISRVYTRQASFQNEENSFLADLMMPASYSTVSSDVLPMAISMENYLTDVTIDEPDFVKTYDELIPAINVALGLPKN